MRIFKYSLKVTDTQAVKLPRGAKLLHVDVQPDAPRTICLWAEVDPFAPSEFVQIEVHGTGNLMGASTTRKYIGSCLMDGGRLVGHVYKA